MSIEDKVYAAVDQWDQERHDADNRGSTGRLLYHLQEAMRAPEPKLTRLSINMNPETTAQLKQLAGAKHMSYTETVSRAIAIMVFLEAEVEAGHLLQTVDPERNKVRELILL